jgi:hypothetical protein
MRMTALDELLSEMRDSGVAGMTIPFPVDV